MAFFKRLFRKERPKVEPMHGVGPLQTEAEQDSTRDRMEGEMAAERERRSGRAADEPKSDEPGGGP